VAAPANQSGVRQALVGEVAPRNGPTNQISQAVSRSTCKVNNYLLFTNIPNLEPHFKERKKRSWPNLIH
jgi:hypothetical protein